MWRVARKLFFAGSHQNQAVSLPHRSEVVGLARLYAQALLRWEQMQSIWDSQDGYNMLPGRKGTAVSLTSSTGPEIASGGVGIASSSNGNAALSTGTYIVRIVHEPINAASI